MAIYYARKTGNVNAADIWATTPSGTASDVFSSFTNQDILVANNFTITLNVNTTVLEVRTDTTGGATAGGGFTLNNGITLNANVFAGSGGGCVTFGGASPNSATINGNITGGSSGSIGFAAVANTSTGTLNIIGNLNAGSGGNAGNAVSIGAGGTINITGNVNGGSNNNGATVFINTNATINITGNVIGGSAFGNLGVYNNGPGTVNITGVVTGGSGSSASYGILNNSNGTVNVNGVAVGGTTVHSIRNAGTGTVTVTRAKGNGFGNGSAGLISAVGLDAVQTGLCRVYEIEYGALGQTPTGGPIELLGANSNVAVFATRFGNPKTLVDLNNSVNLVPTSGNVRSGVAYNYGNDTGSCVVPHPNSVVYGVPVDNTVGSGLLSPVAVWNALTSAIGASGTIGERLKNCSTVATVGKQLEGVL